ncbi:MAG: hypothetical protein ABTQ31_12370 [Rhizobiaceae bacterium]
MHIQTISSFSDDQVAEAAAMLMDARRGALDLGELPERCRPASFGDSQRIVDHMHEKSGTAAAGWKIYFPYKPMMPPVVTPIYDVLKSGGSVRQAEPPRRIEAEVVFRAKVDLPARRAPYSYDEAASSLTAVPAFEILQTRYRLPPLATRWSGAKPTREYIYEAFADNNSHGCFVVGDEYEDWSKVDFTTLTVTVSQDGRKLGASTGGHPMQNPFLSAFAGLNYQRLRSGVAKGQIIATTSVTSYFEVPLDAEIVADFGPMGTVSASFAA